MTDFPRRRLDEVESKVLTLHALHLLGECRNLQLISFMVETDVMNYFDLQSALVDLRGSGQVSRTRQAADDLYRITDSGREALKLFLHRAAPSAVDRIAGAAPAFRERFMRERELSAYVFHGEGNEYHVSLQVSEGEMTLMSLDMSLPTAELAAGFRDRWQKSAQRIYDFIIRELSQQEDA